MNKNSYRDFFLRTIKIRPWLTLFSIFLNIYIFCYAAVNISCLRWILNSLQENIRGQGILSVIWPCFLIMAVNGILHCLCIKGSAIRMSFGAIIIGQPPPAVKGLEKRLY
ncbi:MAG: hypothetical protein ACLUOI_01595 [Eisenbergiella sp.]